MRIFLRSFGFGLLSIHALGLLTFGQGRLVGGDPAMPAKPRLEQLGRIEKSSGGRNDAPGRSAPGSNPAQPAAGPGSSLAGGSDSCASPEVIAGAGPFAFDNSSATTGPEGQTQAACAFFGSTALNRDVWFRWTAGFTGLAELVACNHPVDTKIAVYSGAGCPSGSALACNDDFCGGNGLQSRVVFQAVAGQTYTIQLGLYPFTQLGGQGTFTIQPASAPANDACGNAAVISGFGSFAFDNAFATTGLEGQNEPVCSFFGSTAVVRDVWFRWIAPASGTVLVDTCGGSVDTKLAVYAGDGCPSASAIACNDDACNFQSRVVFQAAAGNEYTIQIGLYPFGANGGASTLRLSQPTTSDACAAPTAIFGTGSFSFDNALASTGAEGQDNANCLEWGSTAIANDVWFTWTSSFTGTAAISTCNQAVDTKLAVYAGSGCPTSAAIACNDDACGPGGDQSRTVFPVVSGSIYTLQVGTYPVAGGAPGGPGTLDIAGVSPPANDDCSNPSGIAGPGPHAFQNVLATTGGEGQSEAVCTFFGSTSIANDLWFRWTSSTTGLVDLSLCAGSAIDSKVAVYEGAGCPTGAAIACNDDRCFLTSRLCFPATLGQTYTIQIGLYPSGGATPGAGSFTLTPVTPGSTNDECESATPIAGLGPHAFDNASATTSCAGQDNLICTFAGISSIANDLWFTWTAPSTARYRVSTCGTAGGRDHKIAVYAGSGCPLTAPVGCDDDGCGVFGGEASACFDATAGTQYTIQLGSYPGSVGGSGTLAFDTVAVPSGCEHDNGTSENAIGFTVNASLAWIARFGSVGASTNVSAISSTFGTPGLAGQGPQVGAPIVAAVWDDPDDDGDPSDAVLLAQVAGVVSNSANGVFDTFRLASSVQVAGTFFVGVVTSVTPSQRAAPLDTNGCPAGSVGRAFAAAQANGPFDLANLAANSFPPVDIDTVGIHGVWMLRADCSSAVGTPYCAGDGTGAACPCANSGASGHGCANSVNTSGARLDAFGSAIVGADTVRITGSGMPNSSALYFQGTSPIALPFGDGLRCVGGSVVRLGTRSNSNGTSSVPSAGDLPLSVRGGVTAGSTRHYQVWYRNAAVFCTASTFNLSNGVSIAWR